MYALTFLLEYNHGFKLLTSAALFDLLLQGPFLELLGGEDVLHLVVLLLEVLVDHLAPQLLQLFVRKVLLQERPERLQ